MNGSIRSISDNEDNESVLVFPDFKVVTQVQSTIQSAQDLWDSSLDPSVSRTGAFLEKSQLKTWVLPYSCVILLCEFYMVLDFSSSDNPCCAYRIFFPQAHIGNVTTDVGFLLLNWNMVREPFYCVLQEPREKKSLNSSKNSSHSIIGASWVGC